MQGNWTEDAENVEYGVPKLTSQTFKQIIQIRANIMNIITQKQFQDHITFPSQ
jgi:hypothetical protein